MTYYLSLKSIEDVHTKEYEKYMKTFSLVNYAGEIAETLDEELDVARFYAELVPIKLTPEQFWSRFVGYFYNVLLIDVIFVQIFFSSLLD